MSDPLVVYRGPSAFDGSPIVAFIHPHGAEKVGAGVLGLTIVPAALAAQYNHNWFALMRAGGDVPSCGQCPRRSKLSGGRGTCYVAASAGGFGISTVSRLIAEQHETCDAVRVVGLFGRHKVLRSAVWGDAAALPVAAWGSIWHFASITGLTILGYTHAWRTSLHLRATHMASVDNVSEARYARGLGWRCFLATTPGKHPQDLKLAGFGWCPASTEWAARGKPVVHCSDCRLCVGGAAGSKRDVLIWEHHRRRGTAFAQALGGQMVLPGV